MATPGNSDQITRDYFDSLYLEMRHIDGVKPDVKFELFEMCGSRSQGDCGITPSRDYGLRCAATCRTA